VSSSLDGPPDAPWPADIPEAPWLADIPDAVSQVSPAATPGPANAPSAAYGEDRAGREARRAEVLKRTEVLKRAEVRDVLAWMRLLIDPRDAAAAVRALARPPIELRQVDLARVIQIARRQRLEVVAALAAALESPQLPPEARERIQRFLELHRWAAGGLDTVRADLFVGRLIERLGLRRRQLLAGDGVDTLRLAGLAGLCELAEEFVGSSSRPTARALAIHLTAASEERRSANDPPASDRLENGQPESSQQESQPENGKPENGRHESQPMDSQPENGQQESACSALDEPSPGVLQATLRMLREEVLGDVARIAGRLGELRLDTELDVSHGVVRYLELLKLAALLERPAGEAAGEALGDVNARLRAAMTPLQREIYESSPLDELLLAERSGIDRLQTGQHDERALAQAVAARDEPSLEAFLPRRGEGLVLSASDVETYRSCPLRYKFARVLKIPTEQTLNQRFGIVVHQVLERHHSAEEGTLQELMDLLDAAWRRAGMGEGARERELRGKARSALRRYHERLREEPAQPLWFERSFAFNLGPHHVRGRVDRVDRLQGGGFELIDYKTGYPKTAVQLSEDIQLSLYAIAAREAWDLGETRQAYYYVLDDRKVPVPRGTGEEEWVRDAVLAVGEGVLAQDFEPTPSPAVCAYCDYRIVCPAAER
jgi:RecB family exonuclease